MSHPESLFQTPEYELRCAAFITDAEKLREQFPDLIIVVTDKIQQSLNTSTFVENILKPMYERNGDSVELTKSRRSADRISRNADIKSAYLAEASVDVWSNGIGFQDKMREVTTAVANLAAKHKASHVYINLDLNIHGENINNLYSVFDFQDVSSSGDCFLEE
jgi:hypothetical protein